MKYRANPETQKRAARAWSKAKYKNDPETKKRAAHVRYAKNSKIKIGHSIQHETEADQARGVLGETACQLAAKQLLNKALQVQKEHDGCLLKMARSIQSPQD